MTQSDLLCYLLTHSPHSPPMLMDTFGDECLEPLMNLMDLNLVGMYQNRDGDTIVQVMGWRGRGVTSNGGRY